MPGPSKRKAPLVPAPPKRPKNPKKQYPFDSHQEDIVVNSTELDTPGRKIGLEHYRHQLTLRKTYEHISTDFAKDMKKTIPKDAMTPYASSEEDDEDEDGDGDEIKDKDHTKPKPHEKAAITNVLPTPLTNRAGYTESIYSATTSNPAVFLAILRIAKRNLPLINFDSAITHLPNLAPNASLPVLPYRPLGKEKEGDSSHSFFVQDTPYKEKNGDDVMTILFLPRFYTDGRHAVGYYMLDPSSPHSQSAVTSSDTPPLSTSDVVQIIFTPCHVSNLLAAGLLEWVPVEAGEEGEREKGGVELGVEDVACVGARGGWWLEKDVVEDWEAWCRGFRVGRRVWERVVRAVGTGKVEGGDMSWGIGQS